MKSIGGILLLFGLGSIALHFFNMEFRLLSWIENWGLEIGWAIRIGLAVLGLALLILGTVSARKTSEGA
jgi:hypothetical protein